MIARLHSGKFWLKTLSFAIPSLSFLLIGMTLVLRLVIFSPERLQQMAASAVAGTQRTIRFDAQIGRNWFPRPTVTLRNITISRPNNTAEAIHIKETNIGLAWLSLLGGSPQIEKWHIRQPEFDLFRQPDGRWNLHDLIEQPTGNRPQINRLIIEQAHISLQNNQQRHTLNNGHLQLSRESNGYAYRLSGETSGSHNINWQSEGNIRTTPAGGWQAAPFSLSAQGQIQQQAVTLSLTGQADWQAASQRLNLSNLKLNADSPWQNLHLSATAPSATFADQQWQIPRINSVATASQTDGNTTAEWDSTININRLNLQPGQLKAAEIAVNSSRKLPDRREIYNLHSSLSWQAQHGLNLPDIHFSSRQERHGNNAGARFVSQLNGRFSRQPAGNWQAAFSGLLDQQPAALDADYQTDANQITAKINLNKLNLTPYANEADPAQGLDYPAFLQRSDMPVFDTTWRINNLQLPKLTLDNVAARILADRKRINVSELSTNLYGGNSQGSLQINNSRPISWQLQQRISNVRLLPLLQDTLDHDKLSGTGNVSLDLTAQGRQQAEWLRSLSGNIGLHVTQGIWLGIDLDNILRSGGKQLNLQNQASTPFDHFSFNSSLSNGIEQHHDLKLQAKRLLLNSSGRTDLPRQIINESLIISSPANDLPAIPLRISGPFANPSVTLDYPSLTRGLDTPEQKQKALTDTLKKQWNWLNKPE